jgi:hypothetical protein
MAIKYSIAIRNIDVDGGLLLIQWPQNIVSSFRSPCAALSTGSFERQSRVKSILPVGIVSGCRKIRIGLLVANVWLPVKDAMNELISPLLT